jgi:hypothetical protein
MYKLLYSERLVDMVFADEYIKYVKADIENGGDVEHIKTDVARRLIKRHKALGQDVNVTPQGTTLDQLIFKVEEHKI